MARTTRYTVTLPDGSTATRNSAREYRFTIVARDDNHAKAAGLLARAEELEKYHAAVVAVVGSGDLRAFKLVRSSYSMAEGWSYGSYHPEAAASEYWVKEAARSERRQWKPTAASVVPWLPDFRDPAAWEKYGDSAVARILTDATNSRVKAAALLAGPQASYGVVRWSSSRDLAYKAMTSTELGARLPYRQLSLLPVD